MLLAVFVLFIAELVVLVEVAKAIGVLNAIGLLILVSLVGAALVKRAGLGILRRIDQQLEANQVPAREVVDGFLVLVAGLLMLVPGFITAAVGLLLLLPPVRAGVRILAWRWMGGHMGTGFRWLQNGHVVVRRWNSHRGGSVIDVDGRERRPPTASGTRALPGGNRDHH
jgi:UPF0716 protein FxsA